MIKIRIDAQRSYIAHSEVIKYLVIIRKMTFGDFKQFLADCLAVQLPESTERSHEEIMQTLYAGERKAYSFFG